MVDKSSFSDTLRGYYLNFCRIEMLKEIQNYRASGDIKYLQINTWAFPYWPGYHPETPILAIDAVEGQYGSRDDNQANMEMPMY